MYWTKENQLLNLLKRYSYLLTYMYICVYYLRNQIIYETYKFVKKRVKKFYYTFFKKKK